MILSEYLEVNDLFGSIDSINPYAFINDNSNLSLSFSFGSRVMSNNVLNIDVEMLAELIIERFGDKWDTLLDSTFTDFNLASNNSNVNKVETVSEINNTGSIENLNKVTGYNDDSLLIDTGSNSTDVKNETGTKTVTNSDYQLNLKSLFDNLKMLDKTSIINTVQTDIVNYITIYIY